MGVFGDSQTEKFLFLPNMGQKIDVTILGEVKRVQSSNDQFNYKKKGNIDAGYYDVLPVRNEETGEEEPLLISTWVFYFLLKEREDLDVGDTITIDHPAKNEYKIVKQ